MHLARLCKSGAILIMLLRYCKIFKQKWVKKFVDSLEVFFKSMILFMLLGTMIICFYLIPDISEAERLLPTDCNKEGKKIFFGRISNHPSPWKYFLDKDHSMIYKTEFFYKINDEKKLFLTYTCPSENVTKNGCPTQMFIVEENNAYVVYYNHEPMDGFILEDNPFSKKIIFKRKSLYDENAQNVKCRLF